MALIVFAATFLIAGAVYRLADTEWATAFKAVSPGLLPVLGVLFALLVGFIAVEVWNTFDKAKTAVATEASALRAVVLLARNFPEEQRTPSLPWVELHGWQFCFRHCAPWSPLQWCTPATGVRAR